jgi:hypothetical protein
MARELIVKPFDGSCLLFQARSFSNGGELSSASQMDSTNVKRINLQRAWVQVHTLRLATTRASVSCCEQWPQRDAMDDHYARLWNGTMLATVGTSRHLQK